MLVNIFAMPSPAAGRSFACDGSNHTSLLFGRDQGNDGMG
jgi:hypothetical protein